MSHSAPSVSFWLTKGPGKATDCAPITRQEECKAGHGACRYLKHLAPPALHCSVSQSLCVSQKPAAPLRVSSAPAIQQCVHTCQNLPHPGVNKNEVTFSVKENIKQAFLRERQICSKSGTIVSFYSYS